MLGEILELEMHFDYFRPEVPESVNEFSLDTSHLYGHACHTVDQVISYFGTPDNTDFGVDYPKHYGTITYIDDKGIYHEEKVVTERGDYSLFYQAIYDTLINEKEKLVKDDENICQIEILEEGIRQMENNAIK